MIRKRPAPHLDSGVDTGFPRDNAERVCAEIMLKHKRERDDEVIALSGDAP
jgi:hypothetical protein